MHDSYDVLEGRLDYVEYGNQEQNLAVQRRVSSSTHRICTNESAALRALALISADTVGQDLKPVLPDLW
jgi:hypothetical protein